MKDWEYHGCLARENHCYFIYSKSNKIFLPPMELLGPIVCLINQVAMEKRNSTVQEFGCARRIYPLALLPTALFEQ
jgi:hypothetical protein